MLPSAPASQEVGDATLGFWVKVGGFGELVIVVLHAFCTIGATVTGVMGRGMVPQLHFDLVPGVAAFSYGKLGDGEKHTLVPPGICQLVQFGSTNVVDPVGASHRKLLTTTVTPSAAVPKTGLESVLLVSPQLSGTGPPLELTWGSSSR